MGKMLLRFLLCALLAAALALHAGAGVKKKTAAKKTAKKTAAAKPASDDNAAAPARKTTRSADGATTTATSLELFQVGDEYMRAGNYVRAEMCFRASFEREKTKPTLDPATTRRLNVMVGLAYQNNKELPQAIDHFTKAALKDPKYPLYHYFLATSYAFREIDETNKDQDRDPVVTPKPAPGATPAPGGPEPPRPKIAPDIIFEQLRMAYGNQASLIPGEKIPNPRTDIFLAPFRHDPRFEAVMAEAGPAAEPDLEADLGDLIKAEEDASPDTQQAVAEEIEARPAQAAEMLMRKIAETGLSDKQKTIYIWALGRSGDPRAAEVLVHQIYLPENAPHKAVILEALSRIGGPKAGETLTLELRDAKDENDRFQLLALLANMQYDPAMPLMMDLLKMDTEQAANQMAYCFGKMGTKAVPLLLNKIYDTEKTVRINAANMILWVNSSRALIPLQKQYAEERDPEVRMALLGGLGALMRPDQFESLLRQAAAKEPDKDNATAMQARMGRLPEKKAAFLKFKGLKVNDRNLWTAAYDALYRSYGRAGALDDLARASGPQDEPELERLRARVLDRQSEECFADYMKINQIISYNRMLGN